MRALNILPLSALLSAWSSLALAQATAPATAPTAPATTAPAAAAYNWWWLRHARRAPGAGEGDRDRPRPCQNYSLGRSDLPVLLPGLLRHRLHLVHRLGEPLVQH